MKHLPVSEQKDLTSKFKNDRMSKDQMNYLRGGNGGDTGGGQNTGDEPPNNPWNP